jgi:hypothetical protein
MNYFINDMMIIKRLLYIKYESPITYQSVDMAYVKVCADRQTDVHTGQKLYNYAPDLSIRGHKT